MKIQCTSSAESKICVNKFSQESQNRAKKLCEIIHTDICGPINKKPIEGSRYFATFIGDMSRYKCVYFSAIKSFKAMAEKKTNYKIKILRSDNGREYLSKNLENFLKENGIVRQLTVPYTLQQNGVA